MNTYTNLHVSRRTGMGLPAFKLGALLVLALFLDSCGIPLVIPQDLRDQAALGTLMKVEKTITFTGISSPTVTTLIPERTEFSLAPLVFPVPGGPTLLLVPRTGNQYNPFTPQDASLRYSTFTRPDGSTAPVSFWPGFYIFCLQGSSNPAAVQDFHISIFTAPADGKSLAFMYLPVNGLGTAAVPYRLGLIGTCTTGPTPAQQLKAAMIHQGYGQTGAVHQYLSVLDSLPVFNTSRVQNGLPVPFSLVDSAGGSSTTGQTRIFGGLAAPDENQLSGMEFPQPRQAADGTWAYGMEILVNDGLQTTGYFSMPWQGGAENPFASTNDQSYWPWTPAAPTQFPIATIDLNQASPAGLSPRGVLATRTNSTGGRDFFLSDNVIALEGYTMGSCAFNAESPLTPQSFRWSDRYPLLRFLGDGSATGWNGSTWALAGFDPAQTLNTTDNASWPRFSLKGLQFLYEYPEGSEWRLWFCQTLVQKSGGTWNLVFRILSIPRTAWVEWFSANP